MINLHKFFHKKTDSAVKYLITGLGNIGSEYENTRHNIGFMIADAFAEKREAVFSSGRYASVATLKYKGKSLVVIKPGTYMNLSGNAVRYWLNKEKIPVENLLVITDDIALPLGTVRIRKKGGDGGHNGLSHIIETLGSNEFARLRFGTGGDFPRGYQSEYVLGKWTGAEEKNIIPRISIAVEAVESFLSAGVDRTMTEYNNK